MSSFEGFVEDFIAEALHVRSASLAQIARDININNPTIPDWEKLIRRNLHLHATPISTTISG